MLVTNCFSEDSCQLIRFDFFYKVKFMPVSDSTREEYISPYAYPPIHLEENLYELSRKQDCSLEELEEGIWGANYIQYYKLEAALLYKLMQCPESFNRENLSKFRATMHHIRQYRIYNYATTLIDRLKDLEIRPTLQIDVSR